MPLYEYEHQAKACKLGQTFDWVQSIKEEALAACPECGGPVARLISGGYVCTPLGTDPGHDPPGAEPLPEQRLLRDPLSPDRTQKVARPLVRRDQGVYENVTRGGGEHRYMEAGKPETIPNLKGKIRD